MNSELLHCSSVDAFDCLFVLSHCLGDLRDGVFFLRHIERARFRPPRAEVIPAFRKRTGPEIRFTSRLAITPFHGLADHFRVHNHAMMAMEIAA
jgi:hypothetical protein